MNKEDSGNAVKRDLVTSPVTKGTPIEEVPPFLKRYYTKGMTINPELLDLKSHNDIDTEIPDFKGLEKSIPLLPLLTSPVSKSTDIDIENPDLITHLLSSPDNKGTDIDTEILTFLVSYVTKKGMEKGFAPRDFVSRLVNIFQKRAVREVFFLLFQLKAATVNLLERELSGLSPKTIYRALHFLEDLKWVEKTGLVNTEGRRARVYALRGYAPEDLMIARERDRLARSPIYAEVNRIVQLLLDDHLISISHGNTLDGRFYKREMIPIIKRENRGGFAVLDLIDRVLARIREQSWMVL